MKREKKTEKIKFTAERMSMSRFIAEIPTGSKLVNFQGRTFVVPPGEPPKEIVGDKLVDLDLSQLKSVAGGNLETP